MALYDRDYSAKRGYSSEYERVEGFADSDSRVKFIKRTYQLLAASMIACCCGSLMLLYQLLERCMSIDG